MREVELGKLGPGTVLGAIGAVLGLAALIVSLSSSADALSRHAFVRRGDIAPGAVTAEALSRGAVHPRALAKWAVHPKALAKGAVRAKALAKGAVQAESLAEGSVTAAALAPGSVYGGALGTETVHTAQIGDLDEVAENGTWTAGNTEVASCGAGERLIGGGFAFTNPGNREVAFLQMMPFTNNADSNGVAARITSNSGGTAVGEVAVVCLK